jgi:hypothetical protein
MKKLQVILIICSVCLLNCSKSATDCKQETLNKLLGKWVDENNRLDTLIFNTNGPGPCDPAACFNSMQVSTTCGAIGGTNQRSLYFCEVNPTCDSLLTRNLILSSNYYTPKSIRFVSATKMQLQNVIGTCSGTNSFFTYIKL